MSDFNLNDFAPTDGVFRDFALTDIFYFICMMFFITLKQFLTKTVSIMTYLW